MLFWPNSFSLSLIFQIWFTSTDVFFLNFFVYLKLDQQLSERGVRSECAYLCLS